MFAFSVVQCIDSLSSHMNFTFPPPKLLIFLFYPAMSKIIFYPDEFRIFKNHYFYSEILLSLKLMMGENVDEGLSN